MATVTNGAILEVVIRARLAQQVLLNVLHYRLSDVSAPADQHAKLAAADDRLAEPDGIYFAVAQAASNEVEYDDVQLQWIKPERYAYRRFNSMPAFGAHPAAALPPNVSAVVTKRSELAGRHGIGGFHVGGVPTTGVAEGRIVAGYKVLLDALGDRLKAPFTMATGGTLTPIIYNRSAYLISRDVSTVVTQETSRVERRRTVGLGI